MLFKFLIITALTTSFFLSTDATCSKWVKLNKSPVCFGAKGNAFGGFTIDRNMFVSSFMLVHRSGNVSCDARLSHLFSYWGCGPNRAGLLTLVTDQKNNILAPEASSVNRKTGGYSLAGYTSSSSALVFCAAKKPHCVFAKSELRLWYGEDLFGITESDNGGRTCADVYALIV
ncbi:uncharacterized protein LOC114970458 [Acropora millepora]|uniref:uncharacterized protein LOC114970458 n=1 Tax=Acropora millepora TaxID=45264 RepID=UPI0010FC75D6|nr:uncharacterized protein LOC114970458 [Acropora millepora]